MKLLWKSFIALFGLIALLSICPIFAEGTSDSSIQSGETDSPALSYQVGAFLDKNNAERLVADLFKFGFYGYVDQKTVHGRIFWAVTVKAPPNPFENFQEELLDAGFPSFPIR
jgi:hypothetical protein